MAEIITRDGKAIKFADLADHDALMLAIGDYVLAFAGAERILAQLVSEIIEIGGPHIQFLWRDVGFRMKTRAVRRTARERFGGKGTPKYDALSSILSRMEKQSNYRNDLLHGAFGADAANIYHGRDGNAFSEFEAGFAKISFSSVL